MCIVEAQALKHLPSSCTWQPNPLGSCWGLCHTQLGEDSFLSIHTNCLQSAQQDVLNYSACFDSKCLGLSYAATGQPLKPNLTDEPGCHPVALAI